MRKVKEALPPDRVRRRILLTVMGTVCVTTLLCVAAPKKETLIDDDIRWRETIGYNPQVHGSVQESSDADVFARVPYAYYPYANELEIAFDLAAANKLLPADQQASVGAVRELRVSVFPTVIAPQLLAEMPFYFAPASKGPVKVETAIFTGTIALDASGHGHGVLKMPDLPTGNYRLEYEFGGKKLAASKTFGRTHFEWEHCTYGTEHKVYAPFTPVEVEGDTVSVVDRSYTVNALGLFDSVISKGRELLAEPMKLVAETEDGKQITWQAGGASGKVLHPDLAVFETSADSRIGTIKATTCIEEDGCAKVTWTLSPAKTPAKIRRMWLEMAVKESEAPLCHMVGMNSMRHNYAGNVPRGGKITWINQGWRPARFEVEPFEGNAPASYQVWEARQQMNWGIHDPKQQWNFAPYVWLGAEERGLAWFGDTTEGYETDGKSSIQRLFIEPGKVVLRVELIQQPVTLDKPRTFTFGLQASPTKPMLADWRDKKVPGGGGLSVLVWGGFNCADKFPANRDWSIVDKLLAGCKTGKADLAWFAEYAKTHQTIINEGGGAKPGTLRTISLEQAKANGEPWLTAVNYFAGQAAAIKEGGGITVYFEEHQTDGRYPEVTEFMDEWSDGSFARYRYFDHPRTWGPEIRSANPASYRDFAVFYANEWMKRGVGIYYDNTYPQVDLNRQHWPDQDVTWSSSIWGHREYYKRVWKRSRELMETGESPRPLSIVGHVTNCQVLPYTTWWDGTLGVEQPGQWQPDPMPSAAARAKQLETWPFLILPSPTTGSAGEALPYPPDYLRAMEMGRMAGVVPHYRLALRNQDALDGFGVGVTGKPQKEILQHRELSDVAMGLVHEIRGGVSDYENGDVGALRRHFNDFGYGKPGVKIFTYWEEKPFVAVDNSKVKWIAMTREPVPFGMLLLQSYSPEAISTMVRFPEGTVLVDAATREQFPAGADGAATVGLAGDCGTRLLYVLRSATEPTLLPNTPASLLVDDFELNLGSWGRVVGKGIDVVPDSRKPANHVLRFVPGHPSNNRVVPYHLSLPEVGELSFKFRIPKLPGLREIPGSGGLLQIGYHEANGQRYAFGLGLIQTKEGKTRWTVAKPLLSLDGGMNEGYQTVISTADPAAPVDTGWHTLAIKLNGKQQQILLDGEKVFEGDDSRITGGSFFISPGWGWFHPIEYVEIDDLKVEAGKYN
jgi:hypothetical protein